MPDASPAATLDELLSQAAWVRRLARSQVADPHAADDVAQEAMARALERPPEPLSRFQVGEEVLDLVLP